MFYFLAGMIFVMSIIPIIDSLTSLIVSVIEILKAKCAISIAKSNQQLMQLENTPKTKSSVIGFSAPIEEVENCEYDED
jgi:hypothetical protein